MIKVDDHNGSDTAQKNCSTVRPLTVNGNVNIVSSRPILPSIHNQHHKHYYENDYREYVCGFGAAIVNIYVTFPINKIIFRQMLHGHSVRSATADLRAEGIRHLYRGVGPPLIQRSITLSLMFGTFGTYHYLLDNYARSTITWDYARFCLAAFLAGSTEAILCPFERIQMLLQDDRKHHLYSNTVDTFKKLRVYGLTEYYRGMTAILLRNGPSNILFFTFRDKVKQLLPGSTKSDTSSIKANSSDLVIIERTVFDELARNFVSGSCVGALISTVFYPLNVVRTQMQTQPAGSRHVGLYEAFKIVYRQRDGNLRMLFRGVHINYSRSFLSWGIINAFYEFFHQMMQDTEH